MLLTTTDIRSSNRVIKTVRDLWAADSLRGRFARGAVWSLLAAAIAQSSSLAASVVTARFLGREQFGKYGIIQSTVGMLGLLAGLGLGLTATKFVAELRTRDPRRAAGIISLGWCTSVLSGGLLALMLLMAAPMLAATTLNAPDLAEGLRIASILLFFSAINGAQNGALAGLEAFRQIARINLVRGLVLFPAMFFAVYYWRLSGAIWALSITTVVTCCITQFVLRRQCAIVGIYPRIRMAWSERNILWTFSTPVVLSGLLAGPVMWLANAYMVHQRNGYEEMGIFSAASQWRMAIGFVPAVIVQFALPILASLNAPNDIGRYQKALKINLVLTTTSALVVALPVSIVSPQIMDIYGHGFREGWPVLVLSAVIGVATSINGVVGTAILSAGSVWAGLGFNAMWAASFLAGCWILVPKRPALGVASAMLAAYLAHTIWQTAYLRGRLRNRVTSAT